MKTEVLKVTWKIVRKAGHGRTPESYCNYIAENENHKHRLKTKEGTKLFEILSNTPIYTYNPIRISEEVFIDGVYKNNRLMFVTNFRKISYDHV